MSEYSKLGDKEGFQPPKLGVGMTFAPALRPFLERHPAALDVLVLEPQTMWLTEDPFSGPFFEYRPAIEGFAALPGHKLVHSVGIPLGGTRPPDRNQCTLLAETVCRLGSPWVSEHLSVGGTPHRAAGFLLPPLQTDGGARVASENIQAFREMVGCPVAVETGVTYLSRKSFEMDDGLFLKRVVESADCGILLDLHNLYCNHKNGRINLDEYLATIPLDRVWEVHVAGGTLQDGFWLDSHSGPMPDELFSIARELLPHLPQLGAINFEMYDTFLERAEISLLEETVIKLRDLWAASSPKTSATGSFCILERDRRSWIESALEVDATSCEPTPHDWEHLMTEAVWRAQPAVHPYDEDFAPLGLYAWLARSFRSSMLVRLLPRAFRYLLLRDGYSVESLLNDYFATIPPQLYSPLEATAFSRFVDAWEGADELLRALLNYDLAFVDSVRDAAPRTVVFPGDPRPVFEALVEGRLPKMPEPPIWEFEIIPDEFSPSDFSTVEAETGDLNTASVYSMRTNV